VSICGNTTSGIRRELNSLYQSRKDRKVLIYTNSKENAERMLTTTVQQVLDVDCNVVAFTGDCGIMMKSYLMAAFCGLSRENGYNGATLPLLFAMPCIPAANTGIDNYHLKDILRKSLPPNKIDVVQEMASRADRGHNPIGVKKYEVFLSFDNVMHLVLCIFQTKSERVRENELSEFYDVLQMLVLPTDCYHILLEQWFERPASLDKTVNTIMPCSDKYPFCRREHLEFTKHFDKGALINILDCSIFGTGKARFRHPSEGPANHWLTSANI